MKHKCAAGAAGPISFLCNRRKLLFAGFLLFLLNPFSYAGYNEDLAALNFTGFTAAITDFEQTFDTHTCVADSICSRSSIGPYYNITDAEFGFKWGVSNSVGNPIAKVYMPARGLVSASEFYYGEAVATTVDGSPAWENLGIQIWYSSNVYMPMGHITVLQSWIDDIQNASGGYKVLEAGTTIGYLLNTFPYGGAYGMELWMTDRATHNGLAYPATYNGDWDKSANILDHFSPELKSYILQKYQPFYDQFLAAGVDAFTDITKTDASAVNSPGTIWGFWYKDDLTDSQDYLANWGKICIVGLDHMSAETYWKTIQDHPGMNGLFVETVGTNIGTLLYNSQPSGNNYMFPVSGDEKEGILKIKAFYGGNTYIKYKLDQSAYNFYLDKLTAEGFATQTEAQDAIGFSASAAIFRRNPAPLAYFSGTVTSGGQPLPGALVQISGLGQGSYAVATGTYSIIAPSGNATVSVQAGGYVTASTNVTAASGGSITLDFSLTQLPSVIFGHVAIQSGNTPLPGAVVEVLKAADSVLVSSDYANGSGDYSFQVLSTGTYNVRASYSGYLTQTQQRTISEPGSSETVNFTLLPPQPEQPAKPDGFGATAVTSTTIQWTWAASAFADGYKLYSSTNSLLAVTTETSATENDLAPNTQYERYVQAYNTDYFTNSDSSAAFTLAAVPGTPALAAQSRTRISVSWTDNGNPLGTNYSVQYSTDQFFAAGVTTSGVVAATTTQFSGLSPGMAYYARVRAFNTESMATTYSSTASVIMWNLPVITGISPSFGTILSTGAVVSVTGSGFLDGDTACLLRAGTTTQAAATIVANANTVSARFSLIGLSTGPWDIILKDADGYGSAVSAQSAFMVLQQEGVSVSTIPASGALITSANGGLSVTIPANTLAGGAIYISTDPLNSPIEENPYKINLANSSLPPGKEMVPGAAKELVAFDSGGQQVTNLSSPVTISINYPDADDNGIVDGTTIIETNLFLAWMNPATSAWEAISGSTLDAPNHRVYASVMHFSVFSLSGFTPMATLSGTKTYPNPWRPGSGGSHDRASIKFDALADNTTIRIYTLLGELVRDLPASSSGFIEWDGHASDGGKVPSGVYFARIKSSSGSKVLKFAIER